MVEQIRACSAGRGGSTMAAPGYGLEFSEGVDAALQEVPPVEPFGACDLRCQGVCAASLEIISVDAQADTVTDYAGAHFTEPREVLKDPPRTWLDVSCTLVGARPAIIRARFPHPWMVLLSIHGMGCLQIAMYIIIFGFGMNWRLRYTLPAGIASVLVLITSHQASWHG